MFALINRLHAKLKNIAFRLLHAPKMRVCGKGSYIQSPFRLDGAHFISIGNGTVVQPRSWLYCDTPDEAHCDLTIGASCVFGYNNHITAVKDVVIGDNVLTANNVYISDNFHSYEDVNVPVMLQPVKFKRSVRVGSGTWIGENVCIIGAHIGRNCVIGANSVVTNDVPDFSVAVGAPAKVIKQFDQDAQVWVWKK